MNRTNNSKIIYCLFVLVMVLLVGSARTQHWTYGKGCGGLTLTWEGEPKINNVFFANLKSPSAFTYGLITFGWPWPCKAIIDCPPKNHKCFACIYPVATRLILTDRYGSFQQPIGIPNDITLVGLAVACQFWLYNPPGDGCPKLGQMWDWASSNPGWFIVQK